jgi:hypothetical protein
MRLPKMLATVVLTAIVLIAQEKAPEPKEAAKEVKEEPREAVIIPVKTLSGDSFNRLARMLDVFHVRYVADDKLRTILVYASPEIVKQMRRVVAELDQPGSEAAIGHNIEMTMAFLRCGTKAQPDSGPLPPDLEAVARQLRTATQYKHIELWDIVPIRMQEGKETRQNLRLPGSIPGNAPAFATADIRILPEAVTRKDSGRFVRFQYLNIGFRIPYSTAPKNMGEGSNPLVSTQFNYVDVSLNTAGDFKEGQKTVVGKLSGMEEETATFVVIALKVLD